MKQVQASYGAFAAILVDGSVVAWGNPYNGGDTSRVQEQLGRLADKYSVVAWGHPDYGGDTSAVQDHLWDVQQVHASPTTYQLRNVEEIAGTCGTFAAILADGSVVAWGAPETGGDSSQVQNELGTVQQIEGTFGAFAAILADGSVVTWADPETGGDSSQIQNQLRTVQQIEGTFGAFVVTWGDPKLGGDSPRSAQERSARSRPTICVCCSPRRWRACCVGQSKFWWRHLSSQRPAQEC